MKFAFLDCGIKTELAVEYMSTKHNFAVFSIDNLLNDIKTSFFSEIKNDDFIKQLQLAFEKVDKNVLIKHIINSSNKFDNCIITGITSLTEYSLIISENFIPIKIDTKEYKYDKILTSVSILKINNEEKLNNFYENIDTLVSNYNTLYENRLRGGIIKYVDE